MGEEVKEEEEVGMDEGQNSEDGYYILGGGVSGGYPQRGKSSSKRKFTGPRFTAPSETPVCPWSTSRPPDGQKIEDQAIKSFEKTGDIMDVLVTQYTKSESPIRERLLAELRQLRKENEHLIEARQSQDSNLKDTTVQLNVSVIQLRKLNAQLEVVEAQLSEEKTINKDLEDWKSLVMKSVMKQTPSAVGAPQPKTPPSPPLTVFPHLFYLVGLQK
ncbi:hypothetical protein BDV19DRAFT_392063 [Aspergillus venezuelensis]